MIDMLSSTLARAAWPGTFTAMVRAGARNSAKQVLLPIGPTKLSQPPARSPSTARSPEERNAKAAHKRHRPARRPVVQAYRVWSKRKQISRRHAVKFQATSHMEEVSPAPLEEVFLMEEILPAPLQEFDATSLAHTRTMNSLRLPEQPVLSCNIGCGQPEPRPDYPSPPRMSTFRHGFNAACHALNLNSCTPDHWRYVGRPFQSSDLDACTTRPTFHCQPDAPVLELGTVAPSLLTSAQAGIGSPLLALSSGGHSNSSPTGLEVRDDDVFLVGGAEHEGVRGRSFVEYAAVPDAFVGGGAGSGDDIEFIL